MDLWVEGTGGREGRGLSVLARRVSSLNPSDPNDLRAGQQGEVGDGEEGDVLDGLAEAGGTGHGAWCVVSLCVESWRGGWRWAEWRAGWGGWCWSCGWSCGSGCLAWTRETRQSGRRGASCPCGYGAGVVVRRGREQLALCSIVAPCFVMRPFLTRTKKASVRAFLRPATLTPTTQAFLYDVQQQQEQEQQEHQEQQEQQEHRQQATHQSSPSHAPNTQAAAAAAAVRRNSQDGHHAA